jgi:hypothetical protein
MFKRAIILYHWSPIERRPSILKLGLVPGKLSKDKIFRPNYICFSSSPSLAWGLSGLRSEIFGEWDLWMTYSNIPTKYITRSVCNKPRCCLEYRIFERIPKSKIWYVGSRELRDRK